MKKHFVTVKISFLTFFCHCIKQYPSISFCAVSMTDQAVSAFLSKDKILLSKEKESSCSRTSGAIRSWYQMQSWFGWTRWAVSGGKKAKESAGRKNESPPNSARQRPTFIQSSSKKVWLWRPSAAEGFLMIVIWWWAGNKISQEYIWTPHKFF